MINLLSGQQWYAWFFIGWHGMKGWVVGAFHPDRNGLEQFRENYLTEGLPPVPPADRARFASYMRCTTCGACDVVCPLTARVDALEWRGPMALVVSMARAAPHFDQCRAALSHLERCGDCQRCEGVCPEHIPVRAVGAYMRDALAVMDARRPPPEPPPPPRRRLDPG